MTHENHSNGMTNGGKYIDTLDVDDEEYQRQLIRPVEVKEDVRQMEERQRVKRVLHSQAFCAELQELVLDQLHPSGRAQHVTGGLSSASAQQLCDLIMPQARSSLLKKGVGPCIPISDVRDVDDFDKGEKSFRCKLASLYRLVDLFGWSHGIQSYITGRINQDFEHFLIAPYGMLHHEVTASNLVKVDMRGDVLDPGSTTLGINKTGFSLHSAIYASRPDIKCVVHIRCVPAVSVSAMNVGLLPVCQEAVVVGDVSMFEYSGGFLDLEQRDKLRRALGPINKVFILRNFGIIVGGETIEEAFYLVRNVMTGVETQLRMISGGLDNIALPSDEEKRRIFESANQMTLSGDETKKWRLGEQEFEALMKHLDNYGYRTGHIYRDDIEQKQEKKAVTSSDVMVPPTTTSFTYSYTDDTRVASPVKGRSSSQAGKEKKGHKSDWVGHSDRFDETSALDTTKASKWAPEDTSTPIKPDNAGPRKDTRQSQEGQFENTLIEERAARGEPAQRPATVTTLQSSPTRTDGQQLNSPQKSVSNTEGVLYDQETSPERSGQQSGRESSAGKEKDKKKKWPFGSKKKDK